MKTYSGERRNNIAYPLGGMGAGSMCLTGWGSLDSVSLRHRPEKWFSPTLFSAVTLLGEQPVTRLLEAPVPKVHYYTNVPNANRGFQVTPRGRTFGLPRFREGAFSAAFPFATLKLEDPALPLAAALTGWSPFVPGRADDSSLPFAGLEYTLQNTGDRPLQAVYSFNAFQFIGPAGNPPRPIENGFVFEHFPADDPAAGWAFAACADGARARPSSCRFRLHPVRAKRLRCACAGMRRSPRCASGGTTTANPRRSGARCPPTAHGTRR